jgi:hypothetical protein
VPSTIAVKMIAIASMIETNDTWRRQRLRRLTGPSSGRVQRGSRRGGHRIRRTLGGRLLRRERRLAGATQLAVELTGGHAAGEEGGERSLLSLAQPSR